MISTLLLQAPSWEQLGVDLINALIPIGVPLIVWLVRLGLPKIPRVLIPIGALGLGVLLDWLLAFVAGGTFTPIVGALLGMAGVWLREVVHTWREHGASA